MITDLWGEGERSYPFLSASKSREEFRVTVAGLETFSLSAALADTPTVFCNNTEKWQIYRSDEHGFNNDRGAWEPISSQCASDCS